VVMATLTSSFHSTNADYATPAIEEKRRAYNRFIQTSGIFDGVADFDAATFDAETGELIPVRDDPDSPVVPTV